MRGSRPWTVMILRTRQTCRCEATAALPSHRRPRPRPRPRPTILTWMYQVEKVVEELTAGMFEGADVSNVPTAAPAAAAAAEEPTQARGAAEEPAADEAEVNALRDRLQAL